MPGTWLLVVVGMGACALGEKILMTPFAWNSHVMEFVHVGDQLLRRGHEVHLMITPSYPGLEKLKAAHAQYTYIHHHTPHRDLYQLPAQQQALDQLMRDMLRMTALQDMRENTQGFVELCMNALSDDVMFRRLVAERYDLMMLDAMPCGRCNYVLAYRLGLRTVAITTTYDPWLTKTPSLPSVVPFPMADTPYSEVMTFWERVVNTWQLVDWSAWPRTWYTDDSLVTQYAPEKPAVPMSQLMAATELWLFGGDFVLDHPRPLMPNEVMIGGVSTKPGRPLPADMEDFVSGASSGVIIMSFGSMAADMPEKVNQQFMQAFRALPEYRVLWRYPHSPPAAPPNVRLEKWLPQNDLLAHNNTRLFLTHCGANSQYEAVYHGVPMIHFPMFGDQPYNARRSQDKGYGRTLSLMDSSAEDIVAAVRDVITDPGYRARVGRASRVFRGRRVRPEVRAADMVEEVLRHGGAHLHSHAHRMPWYRLLMLDILLAAHVTVWLVWQLAKRILRFLTGFITGTTKYKTQ